MQRRRSLILSLICIVVFILTFGHQAGHAAPAYVSSQRNAFSLFMQQTADPGAAQTPVSGVTPSAPGEDGSIVHVVEYGQSLYAIAEAYQISVVELQNLNGLTGSEIYVGDTLIIRLPFTVTPTVHTTPTRRPTNTPRPSRTPTPTRPSPTPTIEVAASPTPESEIPEGPGEEVKSGVFSDPFFIGITVLAGVGVLMMGAGSLLKKLNK